MKRRPVHLRRSVGRVDRGAPLVDSNGIVLAAAASVGRCDAVGLVSGWIQEESMAFDKVLYTARTHTTGGRDGAARSDDGRLVVELASPGGPGKGTNPEQLFAAGWSACFLGALKVVAGKAKVTLPAGAAIDAEVDLGLDKGNYGLAGRLRVRLPGLDAGQAQALVEAAHQVCPYSRATRGNIDVKLEAVVGD